MTAPKAPSRGSLEGTVATTVSGRNSRARLGWGVGGLNSHTLKHSALHGRGDQDVHFHRFRHDPESTDAVVY